MDIHILVNLLQKYRRGRCSVEEVEQLDRWYDDFSDHVEELPVVPPEKLEVLLENIKYRIDRRERKKRQMLRWRYAVGVAASIIIIWGVAWHFPIKHPGKTEVEQTILPGQWCAQLELSDGRRVRLDTMVIVREINGALVKNDSSYVLDYSTLRGTIQESAYNIIRVPVGGEYSLRLADGTQVWLNSGSSMKFPLCFQGEKREVELKGEAYFKVTKAKIPFVVKTADMDIRVLGTSFNVSVYENDEAATTTLVHGRVEVISHQDQQIYQIVPGNTLAYRKSTNKVTIENPDTEIYTSWIKGEFKFRNMRLEEIMVKLNRWYNCTVSYADPALKELRFSGAAEKDRPVNYLLEMIETITDVRFVIKENEIKVMHK